MITAYSFALPTLEVSIDWIESHQTTVDLLKWCVVLFIAWIAGGFKYIKNKLRRPSVAIDVSASRCFIEEFFEFEGQKDVVRATFLLKIGVLNPTDTRINVKGFGLAIRRERFWKRWKPELHALSLPSRPRFETSTGTKLLKNWFSKFKDDYQDLTLSSIIEPKEFSNGYLLFLSFTPRPMAPTSLIQKILMLINTSHPFALSFFENNTL